MRLSELRMGEKAIVVKVLGHGGFRKRILEMGFVRGKWVEALQNAPLQDPVKYRIMGYEVSLRRSEASNIVVVSDREAYDVLGMDSYDGVLSGEERLHRVASSRRKHLHVALVGNPNCGKTSLFNQASGAREHVGNYSGVTVDAKKGFFGFRDYTFQIVDLPGTYSLSAYSPEEVYVRRYLIEESPDVVVNVVDASNLERNLFLTTQLIDMNVRMVVALNMYDELQAGGNKLDHLQLGQLFGLPFVPTIGRSGWGLDALFQEIIDVHEGVAATRHIHVNHGPVLEKSIQMIRSELAINEGLADRYSLRFLAIKALEGDREVEQLVKALPNGSAVLSVRNRSASIIQEKLQEDSESAVTNAKYGFISGALAETLEEAKTPKRRRTRRIDNLVLDKYLGYPIFLLFMFLMFEGTFKLGQYPMRWIEVGVGLLAEAVTRILHPGPLNDLLVNGVIGGVGGVLVFLPNILILYFFISLMEDSGYMARAAFIMDKLMHKMGLHGKSFIPMVMGFGCSVPAILATRVIENRNSRMITMLVTPLMSCSARLPVYLLLSGAFFPNSAGWVLFGVYLTGILLAVLMARLFKRFLFNREDLPFVMELPPYRVPTPKSVVRAIWDKTSQYLKKMGSVILVASVLIWFLGYYPRENVPVQASAEKTRVSQLEQSYIGCVGKWVEPALAPLGFDWKMSVSVVSGLVAKEVVVSTLGVLYGGVDENVSLNERLQSDVYADGKPVFNPAVALSLMVFVLLYFPCLATIMAIKNESGSWMWAVFVLVYTLVLAWITSFLVYNVASFFG